MAQETTLIRVALSRGTMVLIPIMDDWLSRPDRTAALCQIFWYFQRASEGLLLNSAG